MITLGGNESHEAAALSQGCGVVVVVGGGGHSALVL